MRIVGLAARHVEGAAEELLQWIERRDDVVDVEARADLGTIDVTFHEESHQRGSFVRSLRDRLATLGKPLPPRPFTVEVAHAIEGRARLRVEGEGASSDDDVMRMAAWLGDRPGVHRAQASPATQSVLVFYDAQVTSLDAIVAALRLADTSTWPTAPAPPRRTQWRKAAFNTAVLAATFSGVAPAPLAAAAVALTAVPTARRTLAALRDKRLTVDLLDAVAIGISLGTGQPQTAAVITWLLGVGDLILEHTAHRARTAISRLMKLDATDAWRLRDGRIEHVSVKTLGCGDVIVVDAGAAIAADGIVTRGTALVDEKALTGESMPREKREGDRVLAATVVLEGQLTVTIDRVGSDTTASKIVQILEGAGAKPMTLQRHVERTADRLVLPTFAVAGGAAALAADVSRMTSVLITDFGTGIRISVPTCALSSMTAMARRGVLVKGGQFLERLARADVVVFDKTGTLTSGEPTVFDVEVIGDARTARDVVALAAAAEARQNHPVAHALREHARRMGIDTAADADAGDVVEDVRYEIGLGLSARVRGLAVLVGGKRLFDAEHVRWGRAGAALERHAQAGASSLLVAIDGELAGVIGYADAPRAESKRIVHALRAGGRREIVLLSGDGRGAVKAVGAQVGVDRAIAELLPEDKAAFVRSLQQAGKVVAMVGDGINDAPALALADVGVSLDGGTDVALESADVVLLEGGLARLPFAFDAADAAMRYVRRGLGLVVVPNAVAIALGAVGLLAPGGAALVNNGSTVVAALAALAPLVTMRDNDDR